MEVIPPMKLPHSPIKSPQVHDSVFVHSFYAGAKFLLESGCVSVYHTQVSFALCDRQCLNAVCRCILTSCSVKLEPPKKLES